MTPAAATVREHCRQWGSPPGEAGGRWAEGFWTEQEADAPWVPRSQTFSVQDAPAFYEAAGKGLAAVFPQALGGSLVPGVRRLSRPLEKEVNSEHECRSPLLNPLASLGAPSYLALTPQPSPPGRRCHARLHLPAFPIHPGLRKPSLAGGRVPKTAAGTVF